MYELKHYQASIALEASHAEVVCFADECTFFATLSASTAPDANPESASYWAKLIQHLTELNLTLDPGQNEEQDLETLSDLTALQTLRTTSYYKLASYRESPCHDLAEGSVTLSLPDLIELELRYLEDGELVLSCPSLAYIEVEDTVKLQKEWRVLHWNRYV